MLNRHSQHFAQRIFLTAAAGALALTSACAEIKTAKPEDADNLAALRADREQDSVLVEYQKVRKKEVEAKGENPDDLDNAAPLKEEARYKELWEKRRKEVFTSKVEKYKELSADVVGGCLDRAKTGASADDIDRCVTSTPAASIDPIKAAGLGALAVVLALAAFATYRTARRRIDPVAQAGQKLNLAVQQGEKETTVTGDYKGFALRIEASAPEVGEGDGFLRVLVMSKVESHTLVRFGPLAPPTGLDLPDLDAPEVHDGRVPEGYKLRLSAGASAEAMLAGDVAFQLRDYDPVDVRVHDGMCGVTCWQVPPNPDRVIEFVDLAVTVAKLYPQT